MSEKLTPVTNPNDTIQLSKKLSYVLRHGAVKENISILPSGFVAIKDLLSHPKFRKVSFENIRHVVDNNDKNRYELMHNEDEDEWYIRACQGHSIAHIDTKQLLDEITEPINMPVVHGTSLKAWKEGIKDKGLSTMGRNHIHFATGLPDDPITIPGIRKSSEVLIFIDVEKARKGGVVFYKSKNNVILSDGVDGVISPEYFLKVVDRYSHPIKE
ncbi:hypothetical protein BDF20DRAFT_830411 [Mycotypha africana]|uniref:uncharacterized protein n=1 Tax=Mycotypha africana TaxID=64632 RepID=UPI0022FFE0B1|nr:uncharacterized protein BDF20DRAFT_830411 [Mycotypha africana]KAI8966982.1 hypothetical protein BDF20DRAFT_830411 [Mycotypha africana]